MPVRHVEAWKACLVDRRYVRYHNEALLRGHRVASDRPGAQQWHSVRSNAEQQIDVSGDHVLDRDAHAGAIGNELEARVGSLLEECAEDVGDGPGTAGTLRAFFGVGLEPVDQLSEIARRKVSV